jgi:hypothetical protein
MVTFFSIPGASGKVRLKLEMPEDASAVMIRYKTTAWASGDGIATGTLVDTLTDNYNLANEWYEVSGLTNGTAYYFKAFPYNGLYNTAIGENETVCKAGGLVSEYTADSVSGTTVNDTSGNGYNGTASSVDYVTGVVGNEFSFNAKNDVITLPTAQAIGLADQSFCVWFNASAIGSRNIIIYKDNGAELSLEIGDDSKLYVGNAGDPSRVLVSDDTYNTGVDYFAVVKFTASNKNCILKVRQKGAENWNSYNAILSGILTHTNGFNISHYSGATYGMTGTIDQFRYFNRVLTDDEDNSLYAEGVI